MSRLGRLLGLILALAGFAAARALVPAGHAMEVPVPTVTVTTPSLPAPLPPPPTVTIAPTVSTPTVTTPPAPAPPPVTTSVLPAPSPPPVQIAPAPTPRLTPPPTTTVVAPPSAAPVGTSTSSSGSRSGSGSTAPAGAIAGSAPSAGRTSSSSTGSGSGSSTSSSTGASSATGGRPVAGRGSSTAAARTFRANTHRTKSRVSVRLRFALPAAGKLFLVVRGPAPSCRVAGVVPLQAKKGANTVFFAGRVQGHRLQPGLYQLSLSASRRPQPAAPATTVRVVSPRRSIPVTNAAPTPACAPEQAYFDDGTRRMLVAEAQQQQAQQPQPHGPIVTLAGAATAPLRPPLHSAGIANGDDEGVARLLPDPGGDSGGVLESFAAIGVLLIVASLLLGMVALVTRFLRGSWNP